MSDMISYDVEQIMSDTPINIIINIKRIKASLNHKACVVNPLRGRLRQRLPPPCHAFSTLPALTDTLAPDPLRIRNVHHPGGLARCGAALAVAPLPDAHLVESADADCP